MSYLDYLPNELLLVVISKLDKESIPNFLDLYSNMVTPDLYRNLFMIKYPDLYRDFIKTININKEINKTWWYKFKDAIWQILFYDLSNYEFNTPGQIIESVRY